MAQLKYKYPEFSGALQQKSTDYIKKPNEVRGVKNGDFESVIGAVIRRKGAQGSEADMPAMPSQSPVLGAHIARFANAPEIWAAQNDLSESGTYPAKLFRYTGPGTTDWVEITSGIDPDAEVNFTEDLDEVWVSSYDRTSDWMGYPFTVDSTHDVSTTRHLQFAPKARFFIEFLGAMYAVNVEVDGVRYPDRLYKSSPPMGVVAFVRAATTLTPTDGSSPVIDPLEMDSVRYLKVGSVVDVYEAGTETLLYTLTIASVDKALDTVTFATPDTTTFANTAINTSNEQITVSSGATWLTTGLPVVFYDGSGVPGGLTDATVYYVIRVDSTHIQLAASREDALASTAINITSQGSGTHRLTFAPVFGNKDEFWKTGRKGKLTRFWNTDYRNPEAADWTKLPATLDAHNAITAVGKISNRMFIFTEKSMTRFDGQNRQLLRNDVGCIAHRTLCYYDSFMVWLDAKGNIWFRNDESGEQDIISEGVQKTLALVPQSQLAEATAVCVDDKYKIYLGQIDGKTLRLCYSFRTNQWTEEWFTPKMLMQLEYTYQGTAKPHFFDEDGQMWVDEEGDDDNGETIPLEVELGEDDFGVDEIKAYKGIKVWCVNAAATKVFARVDKGEWKEVGQITQNVDAIDISKLPHGTTVNFKFVNSASGDPPQIEKATVWYTTEEDTFRATRR